MAVFTNSFEGGTHAADITTGNSGGASGDAFHVFQRSGGATIKFDNSRSAHGGLAMKISDDAVPGTSFVEWDHVGSPITNFYGRLYFNVDVAPTDGDFIVDFGLGGVDEALIGFGGAGGNHIILADSSLATKATSTSTISLDTWHRIEFHVITSTTIGQIEVKLFLGANFDGLTPDETLTTPANLNTGTGVDGHLFLFLPFNTGALNQSIWFDDIVTGVAAYPGPATPPQQIRPDADTATGGWTTAPLWSKVDEASAGGDVITGTAS